MTMRPSFPVVFALAVLARSAAADVAAFENPPVGFGLTFNFGSPFDPTRAATDQAAADPTHSITRASNSYTLGPSGLNLSGGTGLHFLADTQPVTAFDVNSGTTRIFSPLPLMFGPGAVIGPGSNELNLVTVELLYTFDGGPGQQAQPLLQGVGGMLPTTGFHVDLADGPHYGYISWQLMQFPPGTPFVQYFPRRWAYETQPNTPITVVPAAGTRAMTLALGLTLFRRRRAR
jgi:hypothetical protein